MHKSILSIPVQPLLAARYMQRDRAVIESFYEFHPDDWEQRIKWVEAKEKTRAQRIQVAEVLRQYNQRLQQHDAVRQAIERLQNPQALVVIGGHQSSLLTGPLFVLYKALSIIKMAQEAERKLARPVVPIFWIAGEDHDFDEVNHTYIMNADFALQKISLNKPTSLRMPVSQIRLDNCAWEMVWQNLHQRLPQTEFTPNLLARLQEMVRTCSTLTESFAIILSHLFGGEGLVLLDAADPKLRAIETPMFQTLITENERLQIAYTASEQALIAQQYPLQVQRSPHSANLFFITTEGRQLLYQQNDKFHNRSGTIKQTKAQLLKNAVMSPNQLSNNVLTRPLMQEYLFPTLATVLGPGEIAYWAQTKQAFRVLGMRMPIIWPRMGFTCVEGTLQKLLHKYGVSIEDIIYSFKEKQGIWLQSQDELRIDERFTALRSEVDDKYTVLLQLLATSLPTLNQLAITNQAKVLEQIDFLHRRAKQALTKQHEVGIRHWQRMKVSLYPMEKSQERILNMLAYASRYGEDWFSWLRAQPVLWNGEHRILALQ